MQVMNERITIIKGLMGGKPTIRGLRFCVSDVLELFQSGMNREQILEENPVLEVEDIDACLSYAIEEVNNNSVGPEDKIIDEAG
ncbi:MAG: DUF433 domain-containing protein [Chryseobacterium sp.]|nr:MAG: DUF433 domain-containing protein [Chryseobacterium sp.]